MNKAFVGMYIVVVAAAVYFSDNPQVTYMRGLIAAHVKNFHQGQVASANVYRLNVPFHRQEHTLSCEIASLKMALSGVGLNIPESELISHLPFDSTPRGNGVWGNPYQAFVGDIDGKMMQSGYGVYWDPIAQVGARYRRTEVIHNGALGELIYHLNQGRPVVVWGYYGNGARYEWKTPDGGLVRAVNGEHARVLIGYTGNMANPENLILLDPIYGELVWSVEQFLSNWAALENGAVVVYPTPRWVKTYNSNVVWELNAEGTTRHALAMDWQSFVAGGGIGEGIQVVSQDWLDSKPVGPPLTSLQ